MIDSKLNDLLHDMLDRIEELEGGDAGKGLKRERELLQRERNLSASERAASSAEGAGLAERLNAARDDYNARIAALEERFTELNAALDTRAKSVKTGGLLLQTALAETQAQISAAEVELSDLGVERLQLKNSMGPLRAEIDLLRDEIHNSKKPLRELAMEAVQTASAADIDNRIAQGIDQAIRRGIDAGLLAPGPALQPAELQPKPERPVSAGD